MPSSHGGVEAESASSPTRTVVSAEATARSARASAFEMRGMVAPPSRQHSRDRVKTSRVNFYMMASLDGTPRFRPQQRGREGSMQLFKEIAGQGPALLCIHGGL